MKITLRTLTPLWTGGIDGKVDRIHETGIIGSLRWWYEALIRGLGGQACDPSQGTCQFDAEKYTKSRAPDERQRLRDAGLCDVCQVFGATGWRRRFRLEVLEDNTQPAWSPPPDVINVRPPGRTRGWYLPPGRVGTFTLRLEGEPQALRMLAAILLFLERWGNLGAKPQLGYGLFTFADAESREKVKRRAEDWRWQDMGSLSPSNRFPDLRRFGFFRYRFRPDKPGWWTQVPGMPRVAPQVQPLISRFSMVPLAPSLKNEWRFNRWQGSWGDDREIFGTLRPDRKRSRVAVSWARKRAEGEWEIRGWVWLPEKERTAHQLWQVLTDIDVWRQVVGVEGTFERRQVQTAQEVLNLLQESMQ